MCISVFLGHSNEKSDLYYCELRNKSDVMCKGCARVIKATGKVIVIRGHDHPAQPENKKAQELKVIFMTLSAFNIVYFRLKL